MHRTLYLSPPSFVQYAETVILGMQELEGELREEKEAHQADSKRAQELGVVASQLQQVKVELEQESATLKADKAQLLQRTEALVQQQAELRQSSDILRRENTTLTQQARPHGRMLSVSNCTIWRS